MSLAVEAAGPVIPLLLPGILPLLFFIHDRLSCTRSCSTTFLIPYICVCFLALLSVLSASFGIAALDHSNPHPFLLAQKAVQYLVELGYRMSIVYLFAPNFAMVDAPHILVSSRGLFCHNVLFLFFILIAFLFSILHLALTSIRNSMPSVLSLVAALLPIPLIVHFALSTNSYRLRGIWFYVAFIQLLSAVAAILHLPAADGYVLASAACTTLWGCGTLTLFHALLSAPLPPSVSPPRSRCGSKFTLLAQAPAPAHVHYHERSHSPNPGVLTSEDFTALRDPFASPPPVTPISPVSPAFSRPRRPSTPTPMRREVRGDSPYLSDEALLSQVLLHSLSRDACAECPFTGASDVLGVLEDPEGNVDTQAVKVMRTVPSWWSVA